MDRYIERDKESRKEVLITFSSHYECMIELNAGQLSPVGWFADDIANVVWCLSFNLHLTEYRLCKNNSTHLNSFYARCFSNLNASPLNAAFSCLTKHSVLTRGITHQEDLEWQKGRGKKAWEWLMIQSDLWRSLKFTSARYNGCEVIVFVKNHDGHVSTVSPWH